MPTSSVPTLSDAPAGQGGSQQLWRAQNAAFRAKTSGQRPTGEGRTPDDLRT